MTTPSVKALVVLPPSPSIPAVDANGVHTPAWAAFFHQVVTPKINEISASYIGGITATGENGIGIVQSQNGNSVSLTFTLGVVTGTSFNGITGLSTTVPLADATTGSTGTSTLGARADHRHPLPTSFGTVTTVAVTTANGFSGAVANPTTTPAITLSCSLAAGLIKCNGTGGLVLAVAGTDYIIPGGLVSGSSVVSSSTAQTAVYAVASLPSGIQGMRAMVNNALAPAFGVAVAAGGSVVTPVFYNGSQWVVG